MLCGSSKKKEWHHIDPNTKEESVSHMVHQCRPKEEVIAEIDKCILLCNKCHKRVHKEMKNQKV